MVALLIWCVLWVEVEGSRWRQVQTVVNSKSGAMISSFYWLEALTGDLIPRVPQELAKLQASCVWHEPFWAKLSRMLFWNSMPQMTGMDGN